MYLHIGGDIAVPKKDLVAIINLTSNGLSQITKEFLQLARGEGRVIETKDGGNYKSCVITGNAIYLSTISANTLTKRDRNSKFLKCRG